MIMRHVPGGYFAGFGCPRASVQLLKIRVGMVILKNRLKGAFIKALKRKGAKGIFVVHKGTYTHCFHFARMLHLVVK